MADLGSLSALRTKIAQLFRTGDPGNISADDLREGLGDTADTVAALVPETAGLADGSVTTDKLADRAVTAAKIADKTVGQGQIAFESIGRRELKADSVTSAKIVDNAITSSDIASNQILARHIPANTITGAMITGDTIESANLTAALRAAIAAGTDPATLRNFVDQEVAAYLRDNPVQAGATAEQAAQIIANAAAAAAAQLAVDTVIGIAPGFVHNSVGAFTMGLSIRHPLNAYAGCHHRLRPAGDGIPRAGRIRQHRVRAADPIRDQRSEHAEPVERDGHHRRRRWRY